MGIGENEGIQELEVIAKDSKFDKNKMIANLTFKDKKTGHEFTVSYNFQGNSWHYEHLEDTFTKDRPYNIHIRGNIEEKKDNYEGVGALI